MRRWSFLVVLASTWVCALSSGQNDPCRNSLERSAALTQTARIFAQMMRIAEDKHVQRNGYQLGNHQFIKAAIKTREGLFVRPSRIKKSEENFTQRGLIDEDLVADPELRPLLQEVYDAFQSRNRSAEFYAELYERMQKTNPKDAAMISSQNEVPPIPREHAKVAIWDYAQELGFTKTYVIFADAVVPTKEFREQALDPNQVIVDNSPTRLAEAHGRYSHYLQMLYARKVLNEKFGPGAYSKMIEYFKTKNGYKLWLLLFDYGPNRMENSSHPRFFTESRIIYTLGLE